MTPTSHSSSSIPCLIPLPSRTPSYSFRSVPNIQARFFLLFSSTPKACYRLISNPIEVAVREWFSCRWFRLLGVPRFSSCCCRSPTPAVSSPKKVSARLWKRLIFSYCASTAWMKKSMTYFMIDSNKSMSYSS